MEIKKALGGMFDAVKRAAEVSAPVVNPVGTAVAKAVNDHFHPAPAGPVTPPSPPPPVDRLASSGLATEQKAKLQAALDGRSGAPAKVVAEAALAQASTLPPEQATKLLNVAAMNPSGPEGAALTKIFASPTWLSSTPEQKGQILNVASTASPKGLDALATLAQGSKLTSTDSKGGTLLSNLSTMSTQQLGPDLQGLSGPGAPTRQSLLDGVLQETADPGLNIRQSTFDTCTATTAQYELASRQPAEYARLMAGLTGPDAKVQLAGGKTMKLDDEGIVRPNPSNDKRSDASRLFQAAAMDFANGAENYNANKDKSFKTDRNGEDTGKGRVGLSENEEVELNKQLFNDPKIDWHSTQGQQAQFVELLRKSNNPSKPIVLNMDIGKTPGVEKTGHAVSFVKVENGRVYFRNPDANASLKSNVPGARVEDPAAGIDSMSIEDFKKRCANVAMVID